MLKQCLVFPTLVARIAHCLKPVRLLCSKIQRETAIAMSERMANVVKGTTMVSCGLIYFSNC